MIAGEVEYSSKLIEERPHFLILICFFIILFIVLVPILIMNLLVAAIVDGFQDIQKSSVAEEIELQTRLIIRFQYIVWKYKCLKCLRKFSDPVEEIRLDKKSVIYRFPVDAIHSILKEKQKDVDGVQLKNQLNHISIQNGKVLSCLENIQRNCNGSNKNADCTPETGTSNTRMRTRKQPSPVEEIDTQIAKLERKFESLSKDVKDIKDMLKKVIDREDKLTIQFEQTICQLLEK